MIDEGYIKFESHWQQTGPLQVAEISELIKWREPLYAAGMIGHFADINVGYGNLSTRAEGHDRFVISGTQTGHLPKLGNEHFALVTDFDIAANSVYSEGATEASSESMTHATLYSLEPAIRAVVHIHDDALWVRLKDEVPTTDERVAYGTPEMAKEFGRLLNETEFSAAGIAVMAGHEGGLISIGASVQEAAERLLFLRSNR
jgi:hypothetical protein